MRLAILTSHPVPYHVPLYRTLARQPGVDLEVLFTHDHGVKPTFDRGFGREVMFDVPLLQGYTYRFPRNFARKPGLTFTGGLNLGVPLSVIRGEYDAMIVQGYQNLTKVTTLLAPRLRRKTRLLLRSESTLLNQRPLLRRAAKQVAIRGLFRHVDHFLAIGSRSSEYFQAYGVEPARITLAPYSVDNDFFAQRSAAARSDPNTARARYGLPPELPIFLYCSKIAPHKRPLDVLRAFAVARTRAKCALAYVGEGSASGALRSEIAQLGLENDVHVLGFRNQTELPDIYGACDVFVLPSEFEPWGMVVNEAMASGMAICLSDAVGSSYDLLRSNGGRFAVGDINGLAELMVRWASAPSQIAAMKQASLDRIAEWNVEQSAHGVLEGVRKAMLA